MAQVKYTGGVGGDCVILSLAVSDTSEHDSAPVDHQNFDDLSLQLVTAAGSTLAGAWKIYASNDYAAASNSGTYGETPAQGTWSDVTAKFNPAPVTSGAGSQIVEAQLVARAFYVAFTASSGAGTVICNRYQKSRGN